MMTLKGDLTQADRDLITESNRTGRRVLVATRHACLAGRCEEPFQAVGVVVGWHREAFQVGGWSFTTNIPWESAVRVWWRDEAPDEAAVDAILATAGQNGGPA